MSLIYLKNDALVKAFLAEKVLYGKRGSGSDRTCILLFSML
jgi:hypothetical protein